MKRGKIGLALGGGAARGWAHIGVLRALLAAGIKPDIVVGTSIGAVVGGCFSAGRLDEVEAFSRSLTRRRVLGYLDVNLMGSGLINGHRLHRQLNEALGEATIEDLETTFAAVATELGTGHEIWLTRGRVVDAISASYALPGIFKPVKIGGRWLFDGALVNPIPVSVCRALGARYVIAVNLNSDMVGRGVAIPVTMNATPVEKLNAAKPAEMIEESGAPVVTSLVAKEAAEPKPKGPRGLLGLQLFSGRGETAPGISTVMVEAFNIVQDRIARSRLAGDPPDAVITPRLAGIGSFEFHRADELISSGHKAGMRALEDIHRELETRRAMDYAHPAGY